MTRPIQIAIDGPVGSGKSTVSRVLADRIGFIYLYTGAMYRAVAYTCDRQGVKPEELAKVKDVLETMQLDVDPMPIGHAHPVRVTVNGEDITEAIFSPGVDKIVPRYALIPQVRREMVRQQQKIAGEKNVVMEGRDIGTRVLPDAQLKVYLTASVEIRAKRRFMQMQAQQIPMTYEQVLEDTKARDHMDITRETDPLHKADDAWEFDTTDKDMEEVIGGILSEMGRRKLI